MTMHSSDASTYDAFTWHGGSIRSTTYPTIGSGKSVDVDGMFVDRVGSMIMPATMTEGNAADNPIEMNRILGRLTHRRSPSLIGDGLRANLRRMERPCDGYRKPVVDLSALVFFQ